LVWESGNGKIPSVNKTILIFGASFAWGSWDPEGGGWVERLKRFLMERVTSTDDPEDYVYNLGIPGDTTTGLLSRFESEARARIKPDRENIVIFEIGTNDSKYIDDKTPETPLEKFRENLQLLISLGKKFARTIAFVGLTPIGESKSTPVYWNSRYFYRNSYIQSYDAIIKDVAGSESVFYIDIFDTFEKEDIRQLLDEDDFLHPNPKGHEKIFEIVRDFLIKEQII